MKLGSVSPNYLRNFDNHTLHVVGVKLDMFSTVECSLHKHNVSILAFLYWFSAKSVSQLVMIYYCRIPFPMNSALLHWFVFYFSIYFGLKRTLGTVLDKKYSFLQLQIKTNVCKLFIKLTHKYIRRLRYHLQFVIDLFIFVGHIFERT